MHRAEPVRDDDLLVARAVMKRQEEAPVELA